MSDHPPNNLEISLVVVFSVSINNYMSWDRTTMSSFSIRICLHNLSSWEDQIIVVIWGWIIQFSLKKWFRHDVYPACLRIHYVQMTGGLEILIWISLNNWSSRHKHIYGQSQAKIYCVRILVVYVHIPGCQRLREGAEGWWGRVPGCQRLALPASRGTCRLEGSGPWLPPAGNRMRRTRRPKRRRRERFRGAAKEIAPEKKSRKKNPLWVHNFDVLEVKYGVLLEMVSCFPPHTTLGVGKKNGWETKFGVLLEML